MRTINEPVEAILDVTKITKAIVSIGVKKEKTDISFIPITITEDMSEKNARKSAYLIPLNFCPEIVRKLQVQVGHPAVENWGFRSRLGCANNVKECFKEFFWSAVPQILPRK
ncbi:hypothetical protein, partial [Hominenteromicrobium sp.]|uniref:hypothetical protein n=1 Tax=Hominenteromicrobium sp. TaxID=3073581 RepID=UPI003A8DA808